MYSHICRYYSNRDLTVEEYVNKLLISFVTSQVELNATADDWAGRLLINFFRLEYFVSIEYRDISRRTTPRITSYPNVQICKYSVNFSSVKSNKLEKSFTNHSTIPIV